MSFEPRRTAGVLLLAVVTLVAYDPAPALSEAKAEQEAASAPAVDVKPSSEAPARGADASPVPANEPAPAPPTSASIEVPALDVPAALERLLPAAGIDRRDRAGLLAAYAARKGAPIWVTAKGATDGAMKVAAAIANAENWGLKVSAFDIPRLDTVDASPGSLADIEVRLSLATLKYARHARGGRVEPTALTKYLDRKPPQLDPQAVLEEIAATTEPEVYLAGLHPRHPGFERLRQRYLAARADPEAARTGELQRLLLNLEQWRWMPVDLGSFHITVNVPEQLVRVVRDGQVIHTERVVVGKTDTQTPIFSDEMEQVIFHPFWGVPDSIKTHEVLPSLRGDGAVLAKHNLRLQLGGKDVDPKTIDWSATDIRRFHVYQPPGSDNVLGVVKFRFPNKHDVYMHDTPSKSLFKSAVRTFSHGCMRVQNPVRLAELVLSEDRSMPADRVRSLTLKDAPANNQINLARRVPVHITYFTAAVDETGKLSTFKDIYGHEERIRLGLDGKMHLVKPVPEPKGPARAEPVGQLVEIKNSPVQSEWARRVFSSGNFAGGN